MRARGTRGLAAWLGTLACAVALACCAPARAQTGGAADEFALKTAFLFHLTRFVEWPPSAFADARSPFRICVFGDDPFGTRLDALARRRVGERAIEIARPAASADLAGCQIAYFGEGTPPEVEAAAADGRSPGTLTVSSDAAFARRNGMVALVTEAGRVRLHVNLANLRESPLRVSAKLLEVAEVRHGPRGGRT